MNQTFQPHSLRDASTKLGEEEPERGADLIEVAAAETAVVTVRHVLAVSPVETLRSLDAPACRHAREPQPHFLIAGVRTFLPVSPNRMLNRGPHDRGHGINPGGERPTTGFDERGSRYHFNFIRGGRWDC